MSDNYNTKFIQILENVKKYNSELKNYENFGDKVYEIDKILDDLIELINKNKLSSSINTNQNINEWYKMYLEFEKVKKRILKKSNENYFNFIDQFNFHKQYSPQKSTIKKVSNEHNFVHENFFSDVDKDSNLEELINDLRILKETINQEYLKLLTVGDELSLSFEVNQENLKKLIGTNEDELLNDKGKLEYFVKISSDIIDNFSQTKILSITDVYNSVFELDYSKILSIKYDNFHKKENTDFLFSDVKLNENEQFQDKGLKLFKIENVIGVDQLYYLDELKKNTAQSGGTIEEDYNTKKTVFMDNISIPFNTRTEKLGTISNILTDIINILTEIFNRITKINEERRKKYMYNMYLLSIEVNRINFLSQTNKEKIYFKAFPKGLINFYHSILEKCMKLINLGKSNLSKILREHYYYVIKRLYNFCSACLEIMDSDNFLKLNINEQSDELDSLYLLNEFKDILQSIYESTHKKVSIYARINDWGSVLSESEESKIFISEPKNYKLLRVNSQNCDSKLTQVKHINFTQVFDTQKYKSNEILSKYLSLETQLAKGKGIIMITYGYSGVGKTFTLFGNRKLNGMLQSTLKSISGLDKLKLRVYEFYGTGLIYSDYWENVNNINCSIINHKLEFVTEDKKQFLKPIGEKVYKNRNNFIKDFLSNDNYKIFDKNEYETVLDTFNNFILELDKNRMKNMRIAKTPNNPESSRSIVIYDFLLENNKGQQTPFIIIDLPGREEIEETYIDTYLKKYFLYQGLDDVNKNRKYMEIRKEISEKLIIPNRAQKMYFFEQLNNSLINFCESILYNGDPDKAHSLLSMLRFIINQNIDPSNSDNNFLTDNEEKIRYILSKINNSVNLKYPNIKYFTSKSSNLDIEFISEEQITKLVRGIQTGNLLSHNFDSKTLNLLELEVRNLIFFNFYITAQEGIFINENINQLIYILSSNKKLLGKTDDEISKYLKEQESIIEGQYVVQSKGISIASSAPMSSIPKKSKYQKQIESTERLYKGQGAQKTTKPKFKPKLETITENEIKKPAEYNSNNIYIKNDDSFISQIISYYMDIKDKNIRPVSDIKLFYLFSNTMKELKCEHQINLLDKTKGFIDGIRVDENDKN